MIDHRLQAEEGARLRAAKTVLARHHRREVYAARSTAKLTMPAAPAVVLAEETCRLMGLIEDYRVQVEHELRSAA